LEVTPGAVGIPVGVKLALPNSISHVVEEPFSVQPKSAEVIPILIAIWLYGYRHVIGAVDIIHSGSEGSGSNEPPKTAVLLF